MNDLGAKYRTKKKKPNEKKTVKVKTENKSKIVEKNDKITDVEKFEHIQSECENTTESEGYETDSNASEDDFLTSHTENKKILTLENYSSSEDQNDALKLIIPKKAIYAREKKESSSKCEKSAKLLQVQTSDSETEIPLLVSSQLTETSQKSTNKSVPQTEVEHNKKPVKRKAELNSSSKFSNKKKRNMTDEITPICETVDSFFMTVDDKDYMSVYKPPPSVQKDHEEHPKLEYSKPAKKEIFIKGKKVVVGKQNHIGNRRERRQQQIEEPINTVLHPSWEAKRKQKSLAKFEGKKITFDDQD